MGLLDGLLGGLMGGSKPQDPTTALLGSLLGGLGGGGQQTNPLLQIGLSLMQQQGGLTGLLEKFKSAGLQEHAASWVGTGPNMPITGDQLNSVLGNDTVAQMAGKLGMDHGAASGALANLLPMIVNQMTPQGNVPDNHGDLLSGLLGALTK